ncbi:MAG: cysteine desulfurase [Flavobacteriales bacterium]|nr:MAG: cysteine desulfurase [Flavobacteriales bacterium]
MKIYLDNAATTALDPEVLEAMLPVLKEGYGNPSSVHAFGRKSKSLIEASRKKVADLLNVSPGEIFFTSGGTEADNMAIWQSVMDLKVERVITSPIEHHAVTHTVEMLEKRGKTEINYVNLIDKGHIDLNHLEELLKENKKTLVSLMHANNEIGNLLPINEVSELCRKYGAYFHSDTVQAMGHYQMDLQQLDADFMTCSAHKFHGPKGIGFLYINGDIKISPLIYGGAQERNMRGGTENLYGIVGLAKAMEVACRDMETHQQHVQGIKTYMIEKLEQHIADIQFNGDAKGNSLYTVLNVCLPPTDKAEMLLYHLDILGIAVSAGSACSSGSNVSSHVLRAIGTDMTRPSIRFSFSKFNTKEDIDYTVQKLAELFSVETV